ncbi:MULTISPECIES: DUF4157 domain-containing protein [unclassified Nodularia (in: cyanobacteria)]|uniref:eCIS core domain-containing protein n=1 Tax=unclassified Nodularia (in: cyanobacteria) TaxID=2656917 RepID=UPI001881A37C|nr:MULTISPECIES: DUF4157 domain-containing protein [unclassified Nodularia (in: cyanobacteria)]MBE9199610.1 DUF4157 domain-containing protein [Nodularia sp. LEGE 06071]MCC2694939.1 DUF4157 domain-containing protein [Nodularia sp. LEGE 04288]
MNRQQVTQNQTPSKSDTPLVSGILQRAAVHSPDAESSHYSESSFHKDFSRVPVTGTEAVMQAKSSGTGEERSNKTGLPDSLKAGIENLSGMAMDDVRVHYNSSKPPQLQALAYTQGTDIHVAPGQEKHLPHEAWHVVQQKQGRVKPTIQAKGMAINDNQGLEREADVMGAKALQSDVSTTQLRKSAPSASTLQLKETSFPENTEEELKEMGVLQRKAQSSTIQFRGGAVVGTLKIKSSDVGSSLISGHAWLSYTPVGGSEETHGTWGNQDPIGYYSDKEVGRAAAAERATNLDATDLGNLNGYIVGNNRWSYINNCASFAARGWKTVTNESLAYKSLGIPNPSALGVGIVAANGGTAGVLPADRGSSVNTISSTSSSSIGISSNTVNSAIGSGSIGGSFSTSSGRPSI